MIVLKQKLLAAGKWLELRELTVQDPDGSTHLWESVARTQTAGAVLMIARIRETGEYILIRQFRPPANAWVMEFPAGLVNPGEDFAETAVRELKEETGYDGRLLACSEPVFSSPGLTSETIRIARMEVVLAEQRDLATAFDEHEHIETILVPEMGLLPFLRDAQKRGDVVDAKLFAFAAARESCGLPQ